jgi:hypothetical protein
MGYSHKLFRKNSMKYLKIWLLAFYVVLNGCAATVQKTESTTATQSQPIMRSAEAASAPTAAKVRIPEISATRLVLNISGNKQCTDSKDWALFKEEWRAIFEQQATAAGLKFEWQEGEVRPLGQPGTLLAVAVNDYRFVGQGARILFGVMTGNAYIDAQLQFTDLQNGTVFGRQTMNTSTTGAHGIFAAVTPKQIYAIADDVILQIKNK